MHPADAAAGVIESLIEQEEDAITFFAPEQQPDGTERWVIVVSCGWNGHTSERFTGATFADVLIAAKTAKETRRVECN